jgi:S1-C subfamily serine protease
MLQEITLNPKIKQHYNLSNRKGLFITKIESNTPASRSQLQEGDVIISFHDKPVNNTHELFKELTRKDILDMINVSVIRRTELLNLSVTPIEALRK